jgi:anti-sigma B factor antagonist
MADVEDSGNTAPLGIQTRADSAGAPVIAVSGDLDISSVERLRSTVAQVAAQRPDQLTFDVSELRFMDSAGISVLLGAASSVPTVRLLNPTAPVRRVIELTGLTGLLQVEP